MAGLPSDAPRIPPTYRRALFDSYSRAAAFFPLIGAVLRGEQAGQVLPDPESDAACAYVEHAFGFAQVVGSPSPAFAEALRTRLMDERRFGVHKVRLYTPWLPSFLAGAAGAPLRSERQRYVLPLGARPEVAFDGLQATTVDARSIDAMEAAFGVLARFWPTREAFLQNALPVMVTARGQPAALCYAAAVADGRAEVDVLTMPAHRRQGAGKLAVAEFIRRGRERGVEPLWDCFTNNAGSVALARSLGFAPAGAPYPFFTIPSNTATVAP